MTHDAAYRLVRNAIKRGELVRPSACQRCGCVPAPTSDGRAAIQAHHHDYDKPLDVEWICAKCHRAETPLPEKMGAPVRGERNGQAKLDAPSVLSARRLRSTGISYQRIADRFCVDKKTIMRAIKGERWGHIAAAPKPETEEGEMGKTYKQGQHDGFNNAICFVLGYMNGTGNCGSTDYKEILDHCGREEIIAYARKNGEMKFTGLARYLRRKP